MVLNPEISPVIADIYLGQDMMTSSNGNIFRVTGPLCRSPVNSPHKSQWRGAALMFSLIWAWIHSWVNNRDAGDFRRHRAHYDVIVMIWAPWALLRPRVLSGKMIKAVHIQGPLSLRWRHYEHDSVSNHQPHDCLLNRLFRRRSKKISKLRVTGLCVGNSPGTSEFPAQMASNAENVSIWWRHHDCLRIMKIGPAVSKICHGPIWFHRASYLGPHGSPRLWFTYTWKYLWGVYL